MGVHLRFWAQSASEAGEQGHPQEVMEELGIIYQHATPQSIADQWWFWNCENIPVDLPPYLEVIDLNPLEMIGWGLNQSDAIKIYKYDKRRKGCKGITKDVL